jgi:hypothetical protein
MIGEQPIWLLLIKYHRLGAIFPRDFEYDDHRGQKIRDLHYECRKDIGIFIKKFKEIKESVSKS